MHTTKNDFLIPVRKYIVRYIKQTGKLFGIKSALKITEQMTTESIEK